MHINNNVFFFTWGERKKERKKEKKVSLFLVTRRPLCLGGLIFFKISLFAEENQLCEKR